MSFPINPVNNQTAVVNGIKYVYNLAYGAWRRDFNNVLDRFFLVGGNQTINTGTGDLVVFGGGAFGKNVVIGGNLDVYGAVNFQGTLTGVISTATHAINVRGGSLGSLVYQTGTSQTSFIPIAGTGTILMSNGVIPIWTSTAAITAAYAITATNIIGGGQWQIPFQTGTNTTVFSPNLIYDTSALKILNNTPSTGSTTGALVVTGGVGVSGDVYLGGNLQVNGLTTFINSTNLEVLDKNITLSKGSPNATASDMAGITIEGPVAQPTILYRSATDSWSFNKTLIGTAANFTANTVSVSTQSGAVIVTGGIGVGGSIFATAINGSLTGSIGLGTKNTGGFTTVEITSNAASTSSITGALTVAGGVGVAGNINSAAKISSQDFESLAGTNSTSVGTGAVIIQGGASVAKNLYVGGTIVGTSTNALFANTSTFSFSATSSTNLTAGLINQIPYQSGTGQTAFSNNLIFDGNNFQTTKITVTNNNNSILPAASIGLDLQNSGINQSPAIRLSGSGSGIVLVSSFGSLRILQDAVTLTNTLMNIGLTSVTLPVITSSVSTQTGSLVVSGGVGIGGSLNVGEQLNVLANAVVSGSMLATYNVQSITTITNAAGLVTHNIALGETFFHSGMTSNFTANFTNLPTTNNREYNIRLILSQGGTGFYASAVQIAGVVQTLRWSSAPSATANRTEIQTIRIIRANNAWLVLATLTSFV